MRAAIFLLFLWLGMSIDWKVIVVMLENRSFDHLLGHMKGVDGLKPGMYNLVNTSDPSSKKVYISPANYTGSCDPDHGTAATTEKIFGYEQYHSGHLVDANMGGFAEWEVKRGSNYCNVMTAFLPGQNPVLEFLAKEFALFDAYFSSHPGPTWPNRMYALSGQSAGDTNTWPMYMNTDDLLYPQATIFDQLAQAGKTVRMYTETTPWELFMTSVLHNPEMVRGFDAFIEDCKAGTLPHWGWISPRAGGDAAHNISCDSQHPNCPVPAGDAFLKRIYDALRGSPEWNNTLLLITWDEHGGFFDHVPPPQTGIPDPTPNLHSYPDKDFHWTRLGIRVPLVAVSPRIKKGTLVHDPPPSLKPFPSSRYEHCSMMATARKLLGVKGSLTARDAWAATFEHIVGNPLRDTPTTAPNALQVHHHIVQGEALLPVSDLQHDMLAVHQQLARSLAGHAIPDPTQSGQVHDILVQRYRAIRSGIAALDQSYVLQAQSVMLPKKDQGVETLWKNNFTLTRIESWSLNASGTKFCFSYAPGDAIVSLSLCRSDVKYQPQRFLYMSDATIRQPSDMSKCMTLSGGSSSSSSLGVWNLTFTPCRVDEALMQQFDLDGTMWIGYLVLQVVAVARSNSA